MRRVRTLLALGPGMVGTLLVGLVAVGPAGAHTSALFADTYTLRVVNHSTSFENFVIYQTDPKLSTTAAPLVWQDAPLSASAQTALSWNPDYSFSLSDSADLKAGELYRPTQTLSVTPGTLGEDGIDVTDTRGVFALHRANSSDQSKGTLSLEELATNPRADASVALGMAGRPASLLSVEPHQLLRFTPHPEYWITAGTFTEGEVINPRTVSNPLRLHFGTKAMLTVTLHQGGRWTVS